MQINFKSTTILFVLKLSFVILFFLKASISHSQTSLTRTISLCGEAIKDADIASGQPTINFYNYLHFGGYTWSCNGDLCVSRGLMQIDLTSIPANVIVNSAFLFLYADATWGTTPTLGPGNSGSLLKLNGVWQENTLTWNNQPSTLLTNSVSIPQSTSNVQDYILDITGMTQDWVNSPSTNYGMMIRMDDEVNYYKSLMFASSDGSNPAKCPKLLINYSLVNLAGLNSLSSDDIAIYPNPTTTTFKIKGLSEACPYFITDIAGRPVLSGITQENTEIALAEDVPGIYFLYLQTKSTLIKYKLVKLNTN